MVARTLTLLARLLLLPAEDLAPSGQSIIFFGERDGHGAVDEALLLDAVAVYTRDLGVTTVRASERRPAPSPSSAVDDVGTLLRSRGGRLAFWCQTAADGKSIELVILDLKRTMSRQSFPREGPLRPEVYRAIALKLRASLTSPEAPAAPAAARADPGLPPSPSAGRTAPGPRPPARAPTVPPAPSEAGAHATPSGEVTVAGTPSAPTRPEPLFLAIDYAPSVPSASTPWRHAAALHGIASIDHAVEIDLGVEVAAAEEQSGPTGKVSVFDLPLRLGTRVLRRASSYLVAVGGLVGVHVLLARATAAADRTSESTRTIAGSLGLELLARGPSVYGFAPELRAFAEANLPNTRFLVRGAPGYEAGAITVGFGLGVALPTR